MTRYYTYSDASVFLGEISRRKLQQVAESSDTLRRCVLIHNVMRSTASIQDPPHQSSAPATSSTSSSYTPTPSQPNTNHHYYDEDLAVEDEEEQAYREAASAGGQGSTADHHGADASPHFIFPGMTSRSSSAEQDWLDSILDDLEASGEVHVNVVDADEDASDSADCSDNGRCWHPPLFPPPQCTLSPPSSPPLRPTSPRCIPIPDVFFDPESDDELALDDSPPTSPPGLDADTIDSDDEDDDYDGLMESADYSEANTPSASTEFPQAVPDYVLFNHLPFNRCRPVLCHSRHHQP